MFQYVNFIYMCYYLTLFNSYWPGSHALLQCIILICITHCVCNNMQLLLAGITKNITIYKYYLYHSVKMCKFYFRHMLCNNI